MGTKEVEKEVDDMWACEVDNVSRGWTLLDAGRKRLGSWRGAR